MNGRDRPVNGRDRGQCAGHADSGCKPHPAKPEEFGHSDSRCRACENARKQLSGIKRRAEMRAGTRPTPPPKPKVPPLPLKPRAPTKVAPGLPFASTADLLLLAEFGKPRTGNGIRARLANRRREERIAARIGGTA